MDGGDDGGKGRGEDGGEGWVMQWKRGAHHVLQSDKPVECGFVVYGGQG